MIPCLSRVVEQSLVFWFVHGGAYDLIQGPARELGLDDELVQLIDVALVMLTVVNPERILGNDWL